MIDFKLNSKNYDCACFCPEPDKVVVLGGYNWKNRVELIDVTTGIWEALPNMNDIRDRIDNKVCFVDGHAYVAGGESHKKA